MYLLRRAASTGTLVTMIFFLTACGSGGSKSADTGPAGTDTAHTASSGSDAGAGSQGPAETTGTQNGPAPTVAARQVAAYPCTPAYTQGIIFVNGTLYESIGNYGSSSIRQTRLQSGEVIQSTALSASYYGEGLTRLGGTLYVLTLDENTGFAYSDTLQRTGTFSYQGQGWGLTTDGTSLIMSNGSNVLEFHTPSTFALTRSLEVADAGEPVRMLNELEWIRGEIWANVWHSDKIARIDPQNGRVIGWVDISALAPAIRWQNQDAVANGIAYDQAADRIFVTGKMWPEVFEINVPR